MRSGEINVRAHRYHSRRVYRLVTRVVVIFYMLHIHGCGNAGLLIQITHIPGQIRIIHNAPDVAFEMTDVHRIKSYQCSKESPVCLGRVYCLANRVYRTADPAPLHRLPVLSQIRIYKHRC